MENSEPQGQEQIETQARSQWLELVESSGGDRSVTGSVFDTLKASYTESHRYYHNLVHIINVLKVLGGVKEQVHDPDHPFFCSMVS